MNYICPHCGKLHNNPCPFVKSVEYYEDGKIKHIEYQNPPPTPTQEHPPEDRLNLAIESDFDARPVDLGFSENTVTSSIQVRPTTPAIGGFNPVLIDEF